jgi:hypothetical protein
MVEGTYFTFKSFPQLWWNGTTIASATWPLQKHTIRKRQNENERCGGAQIVNINGSPRKLNWMELLTVLLLCALRNHSKQVVVFLLFSVENHWNLVAYVVSLIISGQGLVLLDQPQEVVNSMLHQNFDID